MAYATLFGIAGAALTGTGACIGTMAVLRPLYESHPIIANGISLGVGAAAAVPGFLAGAGAGLARATYDYKNR